MSDTTNNIYVENIKRHAYIVMLHLVSQRHSTFKDIRDLLCLKMEHGFPSWDISRMVLSSIFRKIGEPEDEWQEEIPRINTFVFKDNGKRSSCIYEKVFGIENKDLQPTSEQIGEYAARIAVYSK